MMLVVAPSEIYPNTYYIFREDGSEVKVQIKKNLLVPNKKLTIGEANEMAKRFLRNEENMSQNEKIIKYHLQEGLSEQRIADRLGITKHYVTKALNEYWMNKNI